MHVVYVIDICLLTKLLKICLSSGQYNGLTLGDFINNINTNLKNNSVIVSFD